MQNTASCRGKPSKLRLLQSTPPNSDCCSRHAESSRSQSKLINDIHRIRPEDLCRPNILPAQIFDIQKLSFQLNFVFDELGCQAYAKPDQAEHHGAGLRRELALFGVALQHTMRMGQDAMGGCVAVSWLNACLHRSLRRGRSLWCRPLRPGRHRWHTLSRRSVRPVPQVTHRLPPVAIMASQKSCNDFAWKKPNSQLVALCVFLWIRAQTPIPLEKPNSQLVALCVFLWIRAQTPMPLEKPNSQLVALCIFLWIRAQTPIPLKNPIRN